MASIDIFRLSRLAVLCCVSSYAHSAAVAQAKPTVIAVSGELTATPLSRSVAQRVGMLLQRKHAEFTVVPADTIAWLIDNVISYGRGTPSSPQDLREVCRQFNASAIVDIMMFHDRQEYRGIAFRTVLLRRPSSTRVVETALLQVGQAVASTADSVAMQLVPQVVESLQSPRKERPTVTPTALRCLDFSESGDASQHPPRAPSNTGCC